MLRFQARILTLTPILALAFAFPGGAQPFSFLRSETLQKEFTFDPAVTPEIEVDNLQGSIELVGYDGATAELTVVQRFRARSQERLDRAAQEVELLVTRSGNRIRLFVDGPFRRDDGSIDFRGGEHYGYEAQLDFSLRLPRGTNVTAKTVNDGEIRVDGLAGIFDLRNVNGGIAMTDVSGSGRARAVNGEVSVLFLKNPEAASYFGSLNGDVNVVFEADLSARLMVKTFNGGVYTDFATSYLPELPPLTLERRQGKRIYQSSGFYGLKVGSGGPEIELEGFNGDIRILKRGRTGQR